MRLFLVFVAACGSSATSGPDAPPAPSPDAAVAAPDGAADAGPPPIDAACARHHVVYLDYDGGVYRPGLESSINDTSSLLQTQTAFAAWPHANQDAITACVRGALAPYDVEVVTIDPGNARHVEIVMSTKAPESSIAIAPFTCDPIVNGIGFVGGDLLGDDPTSGCDGALYAIGLIEGLEPVEDCADAVTQCGTFGARTYVDASSPCDQPNNACLCGGTTANHHAQMIEALGAATCP